MNLEQFVKSHYDYLKSCFRIYGFSYEDVEDYSQDLILELCENKTTVPDQNTRGWIFAVVRNKIRNIRRTASTAPKFERLTIIHETIAETKTSELYKEIIQDAADSEAWPGTTILELLCDLEYGLSVVEASLIRDVDYQKYLRALRLWKERIKNEYKHSSGS